MKLYDIKSKQIVELEYIANSEGTFYISSLSSSKLKSYGYKKVIEDDYPIITDPYKEVVSSGEEKTNEYKLTHALADISLDIAKSLKTREISLAFEATLENLPGGLNVENVGVVDCGRQHLANVSSLIKILEATNQPDIDFRLYDNSYTKINLAQLKALEIAIIIKGNEIYAKKWALEVELSNASNIDEAKAIVW
ncbi:putative protein (DUF4376 domain) [Campylobacter iguaniorum]|uniref:DUF4376 domain-containing protein n=1 Tax=Campylobacter iguaniorum TaxID=1244531 RepID=UPI00073A021C|nr:DUF4376 domain-containing protein [Campylobacter iguaniorum]ALV25042.1 putative protein (DUF4376 domain) [Campylobacter iguaniorum]